MCYCLVYCNDNKVNSEEPSIELEFMTLPVSMAEGIFPLPVQGVPATNPVCSGKVTPFSTVPFFEFCSSSVIFFSSLIVQRQEHKDVKVWLCSPRLLLLWSSQYSYWTGLQCLSLLTNIGFYWANTDPQMAWGEQWWVQYSIFIKDWDAQILLNVEPFSQFYKTVIHIEINCSCIQYNIW